jgi:hypothetical protein
MCSVMQNPLPDHDVASVAFVIAAGVEIAIVFWERGGGDVTRRRWPAGITRDVNHRSMSYL